MPDPRDLTTLANVKAWLNLTSTTDDALLQRLVTAVSVFILSWLDRPLALGSFTEVRDGTGGVTLTLANTPVISIDSLAIDGLPIPPAADPRTPGYLLGTNRISLVGYRFSRRRDNVTVTYTAGYAATPPEVEQAAISLAVLRYRERERIGLSSKGLAGETTAFSLVDLPADVATALRQYRKVVPL